MIKQEKLSDLVNLLLGVGLFVSPWVFGFTNVNAASWNAWISGALIAALAAAALWLFAEWEEWLTLIVGVWVAISPWLAHFSTQNTTATLHVIGGIVVAVIAAVRIWHVHGGYPHAQT